MTSSVLPPFSSKVTVVTGPPSPPSSLVQTRRESGVTSMYLPKNAMEFEASCPNSRRYLPPARTSIPQESRGTPIDLGAHHRMNSSAWSRPRTRCAPGVEGSRDDQLPVGLALHRHAVPPGGPATFFVHRM